MRKLVASIATGIIIAGAAVMNVSAEEVEIQEGDSLWQIAQEHEVAVDDLIDINELQTTVIYPKQKLLVYELYKVEKGDTLSEIASRFDVDIEDIKNWNKIESDLILVGQELEIKNANVSVQENEATIEKVEQEGTTVNTTSNQDMDGKTISVKATAYTAKCEGCSGITATGINLNENRSAKVIAVDPNVIPLGSKVYVEGYGYATAADTGGAIKGNKIDIHVPTKAEAFDWGVRNVEVTIID